MAIRRGAHRELTTVNPDHSWRRFARWRILVRNRRRERGRLGRFRVNDGDTDTKASCNESTHIRKTTPTKQRALPNPISPQLFGPHLLRPQSASYLLR